MKYQNNRDMKAWRAINKFGWQLGRYQPPSRASKEFHDQGTGCFFIRKLALRLGEAKLFYKIVLLPILGSWRKFPLYFVEKKFRGIWEQSSKITFLAVADYCYCILQNKLNKTYKFMPQYNVAGKDFTLNWLILSGYLAGYSSHLHHHSRWSVFLLWR